MGWQTILIILTVVSPLKSELLPIRTYTTADGLAADRVHCIVPDSRGFIWFCTPEGLSRLDGYHFVSYGAKEGLANAAGMLRKYRTGAACPSVAHPIVQVWRNLSPRRLCERRDIAVSTSRS